MQYQIFNSPALAALAPVFRQTTAANAVRLIKSAVSRERERGRVAKLDDLQASGIFKALSYNAYATISLITCPPN